MLRTLALWLVRAGPHGEHEQTALDNNIVTIGWNEIPDIREVNDREGLKDVYLRYHNTNEKKMRIARMVGQLWDFAKEIKKGDLVALPLKTKSGIAIGRVEGDYECKEIAEGVKHIRSVKWLKTIPRSQFDQDLLFSLGAFSTVCEIKRNNAENRIIEMLTKSSYLAPEPELRRPEFERDVMESIDVEQQAKNRIIKYLAAKFSGHNLTRLIESILNVQGYVTTRSEPGKDGGIDILAGVGALGFDEPRICVQVKSSASPVDVRILRELQGVMQRVNATQGLLVAWGGLTKDGYQEADRLFFSIRIWEEDDIINEIMKNYEKFDNDLKAELPLKKIWTLVQEEPE